MNTEAKDLIAGQHIWSQNVLHLITSVRTFDGRTTINTGSATIMCASDKPFAVHTFSA